MGIKLFNYWKLFRNKKKNEDVYELNKAEFIATRLVCVNVGD